MLSHSLGRTAVALAFTLSGFTLQAQGWVEVERPPVGRNASPGITRVGSAIMVTIANRTARVDVTERFRNGGAGLAEGNYLYPLPRDAVFQNFSLWMGEQEVKGEMMNAEQARGIYEEIVRRRRDPALLSLAGHGLVRAQVFPIGAGETRKVALRYTQILERAGSALRLRYAMGSRGPSSEPISFHVSLADGALYGEPYSPTHSLTSRRVDGRLELSLDTTGDGDVEILLPLASASAGTTVVAHAPGGEPGYYMLVVSPPSVGAVAAIPRDVTLVVDVSGSMSGTKLDQAKAGLSQALGTLAAGDRFRLIAFSSAVRRFQDGFVSATPGNVAAARSFVESLVADGGTNIGDALDAALDTPAAEGRLSTVVFMTDGIPSVGEQAPDRLADRTAARIGATRIFTVGVGHDVNTYLLDRLALQGRGSAEYVAPEASVETAMGTLLGKMRFPALVNLRLVSAPVALEGASPATLPDLFYGEDLVLLGRYRGEGNGPVVIEGERNGRRERFTADAAFPGRESGNDFIPRLWAARHIGDLTRQVRLEGGSESLVAQIRDLGLRYGVLTEYTSYLVQEPGPVAAAPSAQSGRASFEAARRSSQMSGAGNLAAADKAAAAVAPREDREGNAVRRIAGRLFVQRMGVWTDAAGADSLHVVAVAPFSKAYFELTRVLPEIVPLLSLGDELRVSGRRASIRVTAAGASEWRPGQLAELVTNFRGT